MKTGSLILVVVSFLLQGNSACVAEDERPNIVLIMADDMGYSDVGCYGGEINTPNINVLAEGGLRFTQFYNTGRCCPTRASLLTGLYPHEAGLGHMVYGDKGPGYHPYLNRECVTIAEVLGDAGYRTMMAGKWHVGHQKGQWPTDRGFEHFYGIHIHVDSYFKVLPGCPVYHNEQLVIKPTAQPKNELHPDQEWYTTDVFTDWSLKFLDDANEDGRPFFLYTAFNAPHWPLEAPEENIGHYQGKYAAGWDKLRQQKLTRMKELGIVSRNTQLSPSNCPDWESLSNDEQDEIAFRREIYAAQIERMDQNIGRILAKSRELKALDNTLVLFLSDNGCCAEGGMFGYKWNKNKRENFESWRKQSGRSSSTGEAWSNASNTPFRLHKRWVHEGGIATPLIAHWPKVITKGGAFSAQVGHVVDLMATCVDVAGATYPKSYRENHIKVSPGESLVPAMSDPSSAVPRTLFWEHEKHAAIREGDWKLVTLDATDEDAWELYDLSEVRTELEDLADDHRDRAAAMKRRWTDWANQANVLPWPAERAKPLKQVSESGASAEVVSTFSAAADVRRPNVILFMADDMGMGDTSAYQDFTRNSDEVQLHTPSMERLARMGVRFTDAHTPSSRCSPTRYGLLTGRDPWRTRLKHWVLFGAQGDPLIEKDRPTLATLFQEQGYNTGIVGKWHVGLLYRRSDGSISDSLEDADLTKPLADGPVDHGFEFARFNSRSHGSSAPNLATRKKGGPGFIHGRKLVSVKGKSQFYEEGPNAYILDQLGSRYSDAAIEFLASHMVGGVKADRPFFLYYPSNSNHTKHTPDVAIAGVPVRGHSKTKSGETGTTRMDYVYENDVALGRLLDWLNSNDDPRHPGKKFIETTIVIFTSDNGAEVNNKAFTGPFRSHKASCYEGGHRVPFLVTWAAGGIGNGDDQSPGIDNATPISLTDLFATFSELLDVPLPDLAAGEKGAEDSISALSYWRGKQSNRSEIPMFCNDNANGFKETKKAGMKPTSGDAATLMMRLDDPVVQGEQVVGQWKILFDGSMIRAGSTRPLELYDLATDLEEKNNRIKEPGLQSLVRHLEQVCLKHRNVGGHRLVSLANGNPIRFNLRKAKSQSFVRDGIELNLKIVGDGDASFSDDGFGIESVSDKQSSQVNDGESFTITFNEDVIIQSLELVSGRRGACGGFFRIGDGAALPVYCVDAHAEKYTKTNHAGILADLGVLKAGQTLTLDSGRLYGSNAAGSWWLQAVTISKMND